MTSTQPAKTPLPLWAKVIDQTRCIGCHACTTACKSENEVPLSVTRTYVKSVDIGRFPAARRAFQVTRCNQCDHAPCVTACPTTAMYRRPDGIVDFDKSICIGCKACIAACPYDAIFMNPDDDSAEKCNFCAHRLDMGLEPACVIVCPTEAILVGDLNDTDSRVSKIVHREPVTVRRPEKDTRPKLFYKGAHQATLDPLGAARPLGGLFAWSEQPAGPGIVPSGHPGFSNSSAAALLSYDVQHRAPWGWPVSLYTWTKSLAAGTYLVAAFLLGIDVISPTGRVWSWMVPLAALFWLAVTGILLVADLKHPERFYLIFTRPQWRSWLVRGAVVLTAFGGVLAAHVAGSLFDRPEVSRWLIPIGVPLAALTAAYTGFLFAQAKARDLWQNPLLPLHFVIQAVMAGAALLLPVVVWFEGTYHAAWVASVLFFACATHLLLVWSEVSLTHGTAHARLAMAEMTRGRFRTVFWSGVVLVAVGALAPWIGFYATPFALAGLLCHEHAHVQGGQCVPLA